MPFACSMRSPRFKPSIAAKPLSSRTTSAPLDGSSNARQLSGCAIKPFINSTLSATTWPLKPGGGAQTLLGAAPLSIVDAPMTFDLPWGLRSIRLRSPAPSRTTIPSGRTAASVAPGAISWPLATSFGPDDKRNNA